MFAFVGCAPLCTSVCPITCAGLLTLVCRDCCLSFPLHTTNVTSLPCLRKEDGEPEAAAAMAMAAAAAAAAAVEEEEEEEA